MLPYSCQPGCKTLQQRLLCSSPAAALNLRRSIRDAHSKTLHLGCRTCSSASSRHAPQVRVSGTSNNQVYSIDRPLEAPSEGFDTIESALFDLAAGKFVVVLDDEDRENEGDLIIAADKTTSEAIAFMVEYTSGVICISLPGKDLARLQLPLMVSSEENEEAMYTAFTVTVDLKDGITTGISAADRAATIRKLADPTASPKDFRRPGHIFPLQYREGGVLVRPGHTEAAVDLARLAGCAPAGVLCEVVSKKDGSMARTEELQQFAKTFGLKCITIADLIRYRLRSETIVDRTVTAELGTRHGVFTAHSYSCKVSGQEHLVLTYGDVQHGKPVPFRLQPQKLLLDVFGSNGCQGVSQLDAALEIIVKQGCGVLVYLQSHVPMAQAMQEELRWYEASQRSCDTGTTTTDFSGVDIRDYGVAVQILKSLGVDNVQPIVEQQQEAMYISNAGMPTRGCLSLRQQEGRNGAGLNSLAVSREAQPLVGALDS